MASRRQLSRIGTPSNGQSHASLSKCALVSNCPPYPVDMPFQLNEGQSETFYATKSDKSSDSNENQTEQQLMNSHCPLQREGVSGYMDQAKTGSLSSRDIEQPPQTPPRENWQPTSTLNSTTGSRDDKTYPPFEWQMKSSPDILPLTASTRLQNAQKGLKWNFIPIMLKTRHAQVSLTLAPSIIRGQIFLIRPSPFSSAVSSTATPDLPLTTKNPETLVTAENNMYLDGADLESTSEGYSRASSNADTDADAQYTPTGGEDEQAKIRACRSYSQRNDERDAFLIECKLAGMSYKEIKAKGKFTVAESTLRGRFRSLTKRKELRVRKPGWQDSDLKLLCEAVKRFAEPQSVSLIGDELLPPKISWKQVGEYIWKKGGSYHFGNATCKKKWAELQRNHAYVQKVSLNQSF
ncbi:TPA_exp: Uncharacterized protein A8136_6154 [Trichophyton benhamiae CBS 112371]|nr:TPA_exp: Uncharacterized protein A8136_6154 [Trichophyton benhamiae CBS 112371]